MKAVIFARVSSHEQEQGFSIEAQIERLRGYCSRKGFEIVREISVTESSTKGERKQFNEAISYVKKHGCALVADTFDRLQRSFHESALLQDAIFDEKRVILNIVYSNLTLTGRSLTAFNFSDAFGVVAEEAPKTWQ
ncbi:MAG: recombinase family protein [Rickettsiales bacterium]